MERRLLVLLMVGVLLLTLGVAAVACDSDEGAENGTTPAAVATQDVAPEDTDEAAPEVTPEPSPEATPEPTPEATPEPTPEATPEPTPENGAVDGETDGDAEAALRTEAEALCPAAFLEPCTESYIQSATGPFEAALCITPDGLWFIETPQGGVGDTCSGSEGVIVAIVGGE